MNAYNLFLTNRQLADLNPLIAGEHICDPEHGTKPQRRNYVLIHSVISGKGMFYVGGQAYPVKAGEAFLILPGVVANYRADSNDPWHYRWIGFDGRLSTHFATLPPVFPLPETILQKMLEVADDPSVAEYRIAAELFKLYARLFSRKGVGNPYVQKVQNYIQTSYMLPLRVEDIANQFNLDRRYLSWLFKQETGQSIQQHLITVRMEAATLHLQHGFSVKETARLVGYPDAANFSKMFKKHFGKSPAVFIPKNSK
ncbi:MAG: AraC family ligand binding domain-containing protein [Oscillospiraceae bacterium]|nr:AraC family ligand binding domain-containing protein [Oscillospiraceae bacterium]